MSRSLAKIGAGVLVALFGLTGPTFASRLDYDLSKDEIRWGEPVTITVRSENPHYRAIQGGITLSFSSRVVVVKQDYGVSNLYYENDRVMKTGHRSTVPVRDIMIENWYKSWDPHSPKTMRVTFFPLKAGVLRITMRAAFLISMSDRTVRNVPASSDCYDQQGYPAQCLNVFVKGGKDIMQNLRLIVSSAGIRGDDDDFLRHLHALIDDPNNREALSHLGIDEVESSLQYFEKYLEMFRSRMADPAIRDSPRFVEMLKRLINNFSDKEARRFFKLPIVTERKLSRREAEQQKYVDECERYLLEIPGGNAFLSLMGAEGDIHFDLRYGTQRDIVIVHKGTAYSFKKDHRVVIAMIDKIMKIKPRSKYIHKPDPLSGYSFLSLKKKLK